MVFPAASFSALSVWVPSATAGFGVQEARKPVAEAAIKSVFKVFLKLLKECWFFIN